MATGLGPDFDHPGPLKQPQPLGEQLDDLLAAAGLAAHDDDEIECPVSFDDADTAARAFVGAGPMALAIQHSGGQAIAQAVRDALAPFAGTNDRVTLPAWYRAVLAKPVTTSR